MPAATKPSDEPAHFVATPDGDFLPTEFAQSRWGEDHLNGPAVVGLAAAILQRECGSSDFMPARVTVDLFRAARGVRTTVEVRVIRDGRRVRSAECDVVQHGRSVARATLLQYRRSSAPPGELWTAPAHFEPPPSTDEYAPVRIGSDADGWSPTASRHQNKSRKRYYNKPVDVIAGQKNSSLVRAVMAAEPTSLVTNLGTHGIGYINGDVTVGLVRLPDSEWIGVQADSHSARDGVAVGTATLFDSSGPFGTGMTTAVSNPTAQIAFTDDSVPPRLRWRPVAAPYDQRC